LEENPTNLDLYNFSVEECDEDPSRSVGFPDAGSLEGGLNLRDQGTGYIHHLGTDAADTDDWGTLELCRCIELAARDWGNFRRVRMQVGDMSLQNGGYFRPHASHQNGIDADMRYMRNDREDPLDLASSYDLETYYDKLATFTIMVRMIDRCNVQHLFTDPTVIGFTNEDLFAASNAESNEGWLKYASGHTDHFHLRIHQPID
jgi:murein endopeptidase